MVVNLLGGSAGTPGTPGQIVDVLPEELVPLRTDITQTLQPILGGGQQAGGPFVAGIGGAEQDLLNILTTQGAGQRVAGGAAQDILSQTISGQFLDPSTNPFLQSTIEAAQRPTLQAFQDIASPALRGAFTAAGQNITQGLGSSPFEQALNVERSRTQQNLADIATNIAGQNFQAERGRQQQATLGQPAFSQAELNRTITELQATALPRLIEDLGLERGLEQFNTQTQTILNALLLAIQATGQPPVVFQPIGGTAGQGADIGGLLTGGADVIGALGGIGGISSGVSDLVNWLGSFL